MTLDVVQGGAVDGPIRAFVRGVMIGSAPVDRALTAGEQISVVCDRFPHVDFPAEIRFASGDDPADVCPALSVSSADQVERLVGPGVLEDVSLEIVNGVLKGTAINRLNGVSRPVLLGRIDGRIFRNVAVSAIRPRAEGGAAITFSMALQPGDVMMGDVLIEIMRAPDMVAICGLQISASEPAAPAGTGAAMARLSEEVGRRVSVALTASSSELDRRLAASDALLDRVVTYLVALILDRANPRPGEDEGADIVREIMQQARVEGVPDVRDTALVLPDSPFMGSGWGEVTLDPARRFHVRAAERFATVFNPAPERALASVAFTVAERHIDSPPPLTILLDGAPRAIQPVADDVDAPFSIRVDLGAESTTQVSLVSILTDDSLHEGPAFSVSDVKFVYARPPATS